MARREASLAAALLFILATIGSAPAQEKLRLTTMAPAGSHTYNFFPAWAEKVSAQSQGTIRSK